MAGKLQKVSSMLSSILKARGMRDRLYGYRIFGQWEKAVGAMIARHARPVSVRGKKLFLAVDSPAWMQQLSLLKPEIIEKVNGALGNKAVKEIVVNIGEIRIEEKQPLKPGINPVLSGADREKIEDYVREIRDADVRLAVRRVIEKDFLSKKEGWKR